MKKKIIHNFEGKGNVGMLIDGEPYSVEQAEKELEGREGMQKGEVYWLQWKESSIAFMRFEYKPNDRVYIHGPRGWASYVDKTVSVEEAQQIRNQLIEEGYHQVETEKAPESLWWFWN